MTLAPQWPIASPTASETSGSSVTRRPCEIAEPVEQPAQFDGFERSEDLGIDPDPDFLAVWSELEDACDRASGSLVGLAQFPADEGLGDLDRGCNDLVLDLDTCGAAAASIWAATWAIAAQRRTQRIPRCGENSAVASWASTCRVSNDSRASRRPCDQPGVVDRRRLGTGLTQQRVRD